MSKSLIVYFSQGGTTARVAESIATGLRAAEWQADLCNLKDEQPPEARCGSSHFASWRKQCQSIAVLSARKS